MKKEFFVSLFELLEKKQPVLLATIISQHGSSPRGTGAHMALTTDGHQIGTIGGGRLEAILQERFEALIASKTATILNFTLSESEAANLEMICGGSISILVDPILPENIELFNLYERIYQTIVTQKQGWLLSQLPSNDVDFTPQKCFITPEKEISGSWLPEVAFKERIPDKLNFQEGEIQFSTIDLKSAQMITVGQHMFFLEPIGQHSTVYIVGAGHIAQKLAPLTTMVGFQTIVLDDREDFISLDRFPAVDKSILLEDFEHVFQNLLIDSQSYVVVVTRGHQFDKYALKQALETNATYIGMIGSRRKIKLTFEALLSDGVSEEVLSQVHSPIGLNIGAETPEEIAISIVAELIQHRAQASS
ncbi:MAG: dehydrogenase [Chloroflexi bacterium HGW-Chloroflexi-3]|nr:MAG: dehydrogenase [Chloroflexi bacterium HGW-Chloroflexi-3]